MLFFLFVLTLMAVAYLYWQVQQRARDLAWKAVRRFCSEQGLQVLDDTLVLDSLRPLRTATGWRLHRRWTFEFSLTGARRYQGQISMMGPRIEHIDTEVYRVD